MGCGLFEIRAKGKKGIARSLFCTVSGQEVGLLSVFVKKAQKTPTVKAAYLALAPAYELISKLIALRQRAGMTQQQLAKKLHTKKSNISLPPTTNSAKKSR